MKSRPVGSELFHGDGQTETDRWAEMTQLIVASCNFANAPKTKF